MIPMTLGARLDPFLHDLQALTAHDVLGRFDYFEVTELFAISPQSKTPLNVLSVIVAEEGDPVVDWAPNYTMVSPKLLHMPGLKGWGFGVVRYALKLADLSSCLHTFKTSGVWAPSGNPLSLGRMEPLTSRFAPKDSHVKRAWNGVLKNNYWNGSHVLELSDIDKTSLSQLLAKPSLLQDLSDKIRPFCPIEIARTSDRLGNVIIQLPVTVVSAGLRPSPPGRLQVNLAWKAGVKPRPLRLSAERVFDGMVAASTSATLSLGSAKLAFPDGGGLQSSTLWDETNGVILWRQSPTALLRQTSVNTKIVRPERRTFKIPGAGGGRIEITVHDSAGSFLVGHQGGREQDDWTRERIYEEERARLAAERRFVQYLPRNPVSDGHEEALKDLRTLITRHGENGAWLWDPYLSGTDILKTLFHSPHGSSDLRALTDAQFIPGPPATALKGWRRVKECLWPTPPLARPSFADVQRQILEEHAGNLEGLCLEYRGRFGQAGWAFHDRFLIFPKTSSGPLAWSLGTSVNMLGHKHHILQRVDDGRLVADAFEELWNVLTAPNDVIWRTP